MRTDYIAQYSIGTFLQNDPRRILLKTVPAGAEILLATYGAGYWARIRKERTWQRHNYDTRLVTRTFVTPQERELLHIKHSAEQLERSSRRARKRKRREFEEEGPSF